MEIWNSFFPHLGYKFQGKNWVVKISQDTHIILIKFRDHLDKNSERSSKSYRYRQILHLYVLAKKPFPMGSFSAYLWWAVVTKVSALKTCFKTLMQK